MALEALLVEPVVAKRAELLRRSADCEDETKLRRHNVNDRAEPCLSPELECRLGFELHLRERSCAGQTVRDEIAVRIGRIGLIAGFKRGLQPTAKQWNARLNMAHPWNNRATAAEIHASFEPLEALLFDEIKTELAEPQTGSVVAEPRANDRIQEGIG